MSSETIQAGGRAGVDWRRAEFVLTLLAFIGFITLPIRITTIYSSLPAHPLFVHVPVVLIPTTIVAVLLAIVAGYMCFRTGDLGAKAVWQGRLQASHFGGPGGPGQTLFGQPPGTGAP
ncbi:MAG TPA: hypothetical protein VK790_07990 [Solirubrobacteraceae bacterium]|jgi:hypothetical protein|nr:hypothetical protein [Solirubrobacteraceae bacterium]